MWQHDLLSAQPCTANQGSAGSSARQPAKLLNSDQFEADTELPEWKLQKLKLERDMTYVMETEQWMADQVAAGYPVEDLYKVKTNEYLEVIDDYKEAVCSGKFTVGGEVTADQVMSSCNAFRGRFDNFEGKYFEG